MSIKRHNFLDEYPELQEVSLLVGNDVVDVMKLITVQPGMSLFMHGQSCENYLLILSGSVRVQKLSGKGQVITLYHLAPGRACELTTTCLLGGKKYPAEAIAETEVRAILIPKADFQKALAQIPDFRNFVFSSLDKGMNELISLVEDVSFESLACRLSRRLIQVTSANNYVEATHQSLAEELGTAREVISRLLKKFEEQGWVKLRRGKIEIINLQQLRRLADNT